MSNTMDRVFDEFVSWEPTGVKDDGSGLPYATHQGVLQIGELSFRCYQLNNGQRLIDAEDMILFLQMFMGDA